MENLLKNYYAISIEEKIVIDGHIGYRTSDVVYFIKPVHNNEAILMEQAALTYYLVENKYAHTAFPIQNIYGEWLTRYHNILYIVMQVLIFNDNLNQSHGVLLAQFHDRTAHYMHEPQYISSYGKWKDLWIHKLTKIEQHVYTEMNNCADNFYNLVIDSLPYVIGISENAIQYVNETETELLYNMNDRGTITFLRYDEQLLRPMIWLNDLFYDHPVRDIAEYIRKRLLTKDSVQTIKQFLFNYETIRPLSKFSWRLLYARLLYPIHMLDILEFSFFGHSNQDYYALYKDLIQKQALYEKKLQQLFSSYMHHDNKRIPMLQWM